MRFEKTRAAVERWDARASEVATAFESASCDEDVFAAVAFENALANEVREAFAADTADVNPRERAFLVHPNDPWIRRLIGHGDRIEAQKARSYEAFLAQAKASKREADAARWKRARREYK